MKLEEILNKRPRHDTKITRECWNNNSYVFQLENGIWLDCYTKLYEYTHKMDTYDDWKFYEKELNKMKFTEMVRVAKEDEKFSLPNWECGLFVIYKNYEFFANGRPYKFTVEDYSSNQWQYYKEPNTLYNLLNKYPFNTKIRRKGWCSTYWIVRDNYGRLFTNDIDLFPHDLQATDWELV